MAHQIPKELTGEERWFSIHRLGLHFGKKASIYNGIASLIAVAICKITNSYIIFGISFIGLNAIAYPLANSKVARKNFDCGDMALDKFYIYKYKWLYYRRNIYVRRRFK